MYRSGDKGKFLADGSIVYLGRIDDDSPVKNRGMRIELNDVANANMRCSRSTVVESVVPLRGKIKALLGAFVVLSPTAYIEDVGEYLDIIRRKLELPSSMTPSRIIAQERDRWSV